MMEEGFVGCILSKSIESINLPSLPTLKVWLVSFLSSSLASQVGLLNRDLVIETTRRRKKKKKRKEAAG